MFPVQAMLSENFPISQINLFKRNQTKLTNLLTTIYCINLASSSAILRLSYRKDFSPNSP